MSLFLRLGRSAPATSVNRNFSSSVARYDVARLTLVGRLAREVEIKETKTGKEYASYVIGTTNQSAPLQADGTRAPQSVSWHRIMCFQPGSLNYLKSLEKGTLVYVEANYEIKEPNREAELGTPDSQRTVFLNHDVLRVLRKPTPKTE